MQKELALYIDDERNEGTNTVEMQLYAELQGLKPSVENIDKPSDPSLQENVSKAAGVENAEVVPSVSPRRNAHHSNRCDWTVTDFMLLMIAVLLFLNFVTK